VELRQEQQTVILAISDQGIGISDDEKQYIFDPFFRAKSAEGIKGTGLGLSIVKECIKLHQGEIEVESTLQKGTTFIVHLPSG
jgi:signal transduction histidine kinase